MTCEEASLELLDDGPSSEAAVRHAAECRLCRELLGAHRAAQGLKGLRLDLPSRAGEVRVRPLLLRRLLVRHSFFALGLALLALAVGLSWPSPTPVPSLPLSAERGEGVPVLFTAPSGAPAPSPVEDLLLEVDSYLTHEVTVEDEALAPFGHLPRLLAPAHPGATVATGVQPTGAP